MRFVFKRIGPLRTGCPNWKLTNQRAFLRDVPRLLNAPEPRPPAAPAAASKAAPATAPEADEDGQRFRGTPAAFGDEDPAPTRCYATWLEVELAACASMEEAGLVPQGTAAVIRDKARRARSRADRRDRANDHEARRHRVPHARRGARRRRGALPPPRHDVERRGRLQASRCSSCPRVRPAPRAHGCVRRGARAARARARRDADDRPQPRHPRRADHVRRRARRTPRRGAARSRSPRRRARRDRDRQDRGRGWHVRAPHADDRGARARIARPRRRDGLDTGRRARSARRVLLRARRRRRGHRAARDQRASLAAHRGGRGRGALHERPKGLERDAPQAEPHREREPVRPRARRPRRCDARARGRRAVARAGHLALVGRARHRPRRDDRARLHARARDGARRRARRVPRGAQAKPRCCWNGPLFSQPGGAPRADRPEETSRASAARSSCSAARWT